MLKVRFTIPKMTKLGIASLVLATSLELGCSSSSVTAQPDAGPTHDASSPPPKDSGSPDVAKGNDAAKPPTDASDNDAALDGGHGKEGGGVGHPRGKLVDGGAAFE